MIYGGQPPTPIGRLLKWARTLGLGPYPVLANTLVAPQPCHLPAGWPKALSPQTLRQAGARDRTPDGVQTIFQLPLDTGMDTARNQEDATGKRFSYAQLGRNPCGCCLRAKGKVRTC